MQRFRILPLAALICLITTATFAQQNQTTEEEQARETEIIIIEETVDEYGNKTVNKTVRKGVFTDEEIERIVEEESAKDAHADMHKAHSPRGFLGVHIENVEDQGVEITELIEGSPAASSGLAVGDVIKAVGGQEVNDVGGLSELVSSFEPGENVEITYAREGAPGSVSVTLAEREDATMERHFEHMKKIEKEAYHKKENKRKLGVYLDSDDGQVSISRVSEGGIAEAAGLQSGDVITSFNGQSIDSVDGLVGAIQGATAGEEVTVEYVRDGQKHTKKVSFDF